MISLSWPALVHLLCTAFMTGLIWVIQLIHYPAFALIHPERFSTFHQLHSHRITWIVFPVMTVELLSAGYLAWATAGGWIYLINLILLILIWASTGLLSVPLHNSLAVRSEEILHRRLVLTNWPRTLLWSSRLILLTVFFIGFSSRTGN